MYWKQPKIQAAACGQWILILFCFGLAWASPAKSQELPLFQTIVDQTASQGQTFRLQPQLTNQTKTGTVNWSKAFGPDDISVHPVTGEIRWAISANLPSESFYMTVRASNTAGASTESFIIHVGVPKVVYVGPNESVKNFHDAFAAWKNPGRHLRTPGTTFVIRNGNYTGENWVIGLTRKGLIQFPPAGGPEGYTTVMAEDPGQVTLSGDAAIVGRGSIGEVAYWAIKGFFMDGTSLGVEGGDCKDRNCRPHHIKFIANGLNLAQDASSFGASYSDTILFESNYAYGGHRTKFSAFRTKNVIFRRNLGRFDHNAVYTNPMNTFSFYTSINVLAQNNIAIDSDQKDFIASGEQAGEFGCPTTAGDSIARWDRNIQLNSVMLHSNIDRQNGNCYGILRDSIGWDNRAPQAFIMTRSPSLFNHATFGAIYRETDELLFNAWPSEYARGITNSIIHDVNQGTLFEGFVVGTTEGPNNSKLRRYGIDTLNLSQFSGELTRNRNTIKRRTLTRLDPLWSPSNPKGGLRYLVRMEANSNMSNKAQDGLDLGARVMTFKGKSGTMWGEPGFEQDTSIPSWPFPLQDLMAEKMRNMSHTGPTWQGPWHERTPGPVKTLSGDRGFANTKTNLTDYIWGYLGSTVPPFNVSATAQVSKSKGIDKTFSAVILWDKGPDTSITGYKVYEFDPVKNTLSRPKQVGLVNSILIKNLKPAQDHYFVVTALSKNKPESSWSYPVQVNDSSLAPAVAFPAPNPAPSK